MIFSYRDYAIVNAKICMLKGRADYLRRRIANPQEMSAARAEVERIEMRIQELSCFLVQYQRLLAKTADVKLPANLSDIPSFLVQRRIHVKLSQTQLSQLMGVARQTIARYEKTNYAAATMKRILQVDAVLRQLETGRGIIHERD